MILMRELWALRLRREGLGTIEETQLGSEPRNMRAGANGIRQKEGRAEYYRRLGVVSWEMRRLHRDGRGARSEASDRDIARMLAEGIAEREILRKLKIGNPRLVRVKRQLKALALEIEDGEDDDREDPTPT